MITPPRPAAPHSPEDQKIWWLVCAVLIYGMLAALFYNYVFLGSYLGLEWPWASLGEGPQIFANDLTRLIALSATFDPYQLVRTYIPVEPVPYPPFAFLTFGLLAQLPLSLAFVLFYGVMVGGLGILIWRQLDFLAVAPRLVGLITLLLCPFGFFYLMDRGNLDGWVILAAWTGILLAAMNSPHRQLNTLGAVLIGLAAALKVYPLFYAVIYLRDRRWREFLTVFLSCAAFSLIAVFFLEGSLLHQIKGFLAENRLTDICFSRIGACNNLSLLTLVITTLGYLGVDLPNSIAITRPLYMIFSLGLMAGMGWLIYHKRPAFAVAVLLATLVILWVPPMSYNYKQAFLLIPLLLLLRERPAGYGILVLLIAFVMVPKRVFDELIYSTMIIHPLLLASFGVALLMIYGLMRPKMLDWLRQNLTSIVLIFITAMTVVHGAAAARHLAVPTLAGETFGITMTKADLRGIFAQGWGDVESDGTNSWRWTKGCFAQLNLRLLPDQDYELRLTAMTHNRNEKQQLMLYFNQQPLGSLPVSAKAATELVYKISGARITRTKIMPDRLTLVTSHCNPPADGNQAPLGISIARIDFDRL